MWQDPSSLWVRSFPGPGFLDYLKTEGDRYGKDTLIYCSALSTVDKVWQPVLVPAAVTSQQWWTMTWTHESNKPFLHEVAFVRYFPQQNKNQTKNCLSIRYSLFIDLPGSHWGGPWRNSLTGAPVLSMEKAAVQISWKRGVSFLTLVLCSYEPRPLTASPKQTGKHHPQCFSTTSLELSNPHAMGALLVHHWRPQTAL